MVSSKWRAVHRYLYDLSPLDRGVEIAALLLTCGLIVFCAFVFSSLPDEIPVHFNSAGYPDAYDTKATIWWLPLLAIVCYAALTFLGRLRTNTFGPPPQQQALRVKLGQRLMRVLKLGLAIAFLFLAVFQVRIAISDTEARLGMAFFWVILTGIVVSAGYAAYRYVRAG